MKRPVHVILLAMMLVAGCQKQQEGTQSFANSAASQQASAAKWDRTGDFVAGFGREALAPSRRDAHVSYSLNPAAEEFFVHVPGDYHGDAAYGLIVFTDAADDSRGLPQGWQEVLDRRRYLYVAPQKAGNGQYINRRLGLAVLAVRWRCKSITKLIPRASMLLAISGGARMSGLLGFYQADIFTGTIQNCGADFYQPVPMVAATSSLDTAGKPYGIFDATAGEIAAARRVRFVLITGSGDFRRGNIVDIFNGGFAKHDFQAKLFDVPGMGHDTADGQTLSEALDFLEKSH